MLARYFLLIVGMGLSMGTGCDSRKGAEYRKLESFMEQRIDLSRLYAPEDLAKSTVRMPGPKIVHYLDSSGCVGCKLQSLRMWCEGVCAFRSFWSFTSRICRRSMPR